MLGGNSMKANWRTIGGIGAVSALVAACAAGVIASRGGRGAATTPLQVRPVSELGKDFPPELTVGELQVSIKEWDVPTKWAHPPDPAVGMDCAAGFTDQVRIKL